MRKVLFIASYVAIATAHEGHADQEVISGPHNSLWYNNLPGDGGTQVCLPSSRSDVVALERKPGG